MFKRIGVGMALLILAMLVACGDKENTDQQKKVNEDQLADNGNVEVDEDENQASEAESETPEGYARMKMVEDGEDVILEQSITSPMKLPINFPFPLTDDNSIVRGSDRYLWPGEDVTYYVRYEAQMEFEEIVSFYEKALSDKGLSNSLETNEPPNLVILSGDFGSIKIEDVYDLEFYEVTITTKR